MSDIKKLKLNGVIYNITAEPDTSNLVTKSGLAQSTGSATDNAMSQDATTTAINEKQEKIDSSHKLSADLIADGSTNKTVTSTEKTTWNEKQNALISGTNIKTINNESILGSGNITIQGGGTSTDVQINGTSIVSNNTANILTNTAYDSSTNKIATMSDVPSLVNYYTKTESEANFADKTHTISNASHGWKGYIGTSDTDAYNALIFQINRYLNGQGFSLKTQYLDSNKYPYLFIYDILKTTRDTDNNVAQIEITAKCLPSGYRIENSSAKSYGVPYSTIQTETYCYCYVPLTEFDNKQITDIYGERQLTNKELKTSSIYYYYAFKSSNLKVLGIENTTAYTPTADYHPATKKYVDDIVGDINTALENIIGGGE